MDVGNINFKNMDEKLKRDLERYLVSYATMRKYQKSFFGGNKAALKQAMYYENQTDNFAKLLQVDHKLTVVVGKGDATQSTML